MKNIVKFLISVFALILTDRLFKSVWFDDYITVIIFALVLYLLDRFVKPVLIFLTLPVTLFSLGIFLLFINAFIILTGAKLVKGIHIPGFWTALWFSLVYSLIKILLEKNRHIARFCHSTFIATSCGKICEFRKT